LWLFEFVFWRKRATERITPDERILSMRLDDGQLDSSGPPGMLVPRSAATTIEVFPENLREWVEEPQLALIVAKTVDQMRIIFPTEEFPPTWRIVLGVLTYFYSTGVYLSEDVEVALRQSRDRTVLDNAFGKTEPASAIRMFRRRHHAVLERCLSDVLQRVYEAVNASCHRMQPDFVAEAATRVDMAVRLDCWTSDF
jgi:hypothetical protein